MNINLTSIYSLERTDVISLDTFSELTTYLNNCCDFETLDDISIAIYDFCWENDNLLTNKIAVNEELDEITNIDVINIEELVEHFKYLIK